MLEVMEMRSNSATGTLLLMLSLPWTASAPSNVMMRSRIVFFMCDYVFFGCFSLVITMVGAKS